MKRYFFIMLFFYFSITINSTELEDTYSKVYDYFVSNETKEDYSGLNSFLTLYVPPGGKYEGMGTAFTGVVTDIGFFNSNPSVSSRLNLSEVSFFVNDFIEDVSINTIAFTGRSNDIGYGFQGKWLHIGFTGVNDWAERNLTGIYSEIILKNNLSVNLLRGFDYSGFSIGTSLNLAYRSVPKVYSHLDVGDQSSLAAFFDLGISTDFNLLKFYSSRQRNFAIGLSLLNIGREFIDGPDPLPSSVNIGFSYSPFEPIKFSYDAAYKFNLHQAPSLDINGNYEEFAFELTKGEGLYHAFGFDLQVIDLASLHGGFLFKKNTPRLTLGTEISYYKAPGEEVSLEQDVLDSKNVFTLSINYSLDLIPETRLNRLSFELKLNLGDYQRFENREKIQELYVKGLSLYSDGNIEDAIAIWEKCIEMDKTFDPAIRMKVLAEQSFALQKEIKAREVIE